MGGSSRTRELGRAGPNRERTDDEGDHARAIATSGFKALDELLDLPNLDLQGVVSSGARYRGALSRRARPGDGLCSWGRNVRSFRLRSEWMSVLGARVGDKVPQGVYLWRERALGQEGRRTACASLILTVLFEDAEATCWGRCGGEGCSQKLASSDERSRDSGIPKKTKERRRRLCASRQKVCR